MQIVNSLPIGYCVKYIKTIMEEDIRKFAEVTGDVNPLHTDPKRAAEGYFGRRVAHGLLTAGLISTVLGTKLPVSVVIYVSQDLFFKRPVFIGDTITASATTVSIDEEKRIVVLKTTCTNQEGKSVLEGAATIYIPKQAPTQNEPAHGR